MIALLTRLDRGVYRVERAIVAASLTVMSLVVFADVIHRLFADQESKLARWIVQIMGWFGFAEPLQGPVYTTLRDWVAPPALVAFFFGVAYLGVRTARRTEGLDKLRAAGLAAVVLAGTWVVIRVFIWAVPNGVVWAQTLALVLTLWVGFVGASMCTYEGKHLKVEIADRLWPKRIKPFIDFAANLFVAVFVFFLFGLSALYIQFNFEEYVDTAGLGGTFEGLPILPRWVAYLALPLSFAVMGLRFVAVAVSALLGGTYGRGRDDIGALIKEHGQKDEAAT